MKRLLLLTTLFFHFFGSFAQQNSKGEISGKIVDQAGSPIEYATITLIKKEDKKVVNGTTTDVSGAFRIEGVEPGSYQLQIESLNYQSFSIDSVVILKKNQPLDIGRITMVKKATTLQDVVVSSSKSLVENKIDKLVFNAEKDLTSQAGVATDILKKVPQVSVDVDGNVQLAGNPGVRFLINGRPSAAFGSNINDVLQAIPASQVKSIEVVTNPGAKYDAQGMGGIINIILKQTKVKGINGNVSLTAGTRMENGSFNLNARKGNFGVNAFISGNARLAANTLSAYQRVSTNVGSNTQTILQQEGAYEVKRHGYQTGAGFDWELDKHNSLNGSFSYNTFGNNGNGAISQLQQIKDAGNNVLEEMLSENDNANKFRLHNIDLSLSYKKTFAKEDQELEISFNSSNARNNSWFNNSQLLLPTDSLYYGLNSFNPAREKEQELNINYTHPIKKDVILGTGGKLNFYDINSSSDVNSYDPLVSKYGHNFGLSNALDYKQKVYALYAEISFPVKKWFEAKLGGRYERTEIDSWYSNAQQQAATPGYNTFVPSVFLSKKIDDNNTVKLSYSKRIERPDYGDLNPFINTSDPKNISAGNPYLVPEIGHRIEFSYVYNFKKAGSVMLTAFTRINEKDIQPYLVYYSSLMVGDSVYSNVTVSTRQNIGTERNSGLNIFTDAPVTSRLNLRSNISLFYRHTINAIDPGNNSNSWNYRINLNASYQLSKMLAGEFFGNFNSARNEVQGKYPSFTSYSIAVRQQLWKKKGSVALVANNPFNKYVNQRTYLYGPNFVVDSDRKIPFRSIALNFTWKFGKLEFKKDKAENNMSIPGEGGN